MESGQDVVLVAPHRMGKTSLFFQLQKKEDVVNPKTIYVHVDTDQVIGKDMDDIAYYITSKFNLSLENYSLEPIKENPEWSKKESFIEILRELLPFVKKQIGEKNLVLFFDEFGSLTYKVDQGQFDQSVYERFRSLKEDVGGWSFILAGTPRMKRRLAEDNPLFDPKTKLLRLGMLSQDDTFRLIRDEAARGDYNFDQDSLERIFELTGGHPYLVQSLCESAVTLARKVKAREINQDIVREARNYEINSGSTFSHFNWLYHIALSEPERETITALASLSEQKGLSFSKDTIHQQLERVGFCFDPPTALDKVFESLEEWELVKKIVLPDEEFKEAKYAF